MNLPEAQMLASQIPAVPQYLEAMRTQWSASRHPENFREVKDAALGCISSEGGFKRGLEYAPAVGVAALESYELSWLNENKNADIALTHFMASGGEDVLGSAIRVASFTGGLETLVGLGAVYTLHKFRPAVDVIRDQYFDSSQAINLESSTGEVSKKSRVKQAASKVTNALKIWGLALSTGSFGATVVEDAAREEYKLNKNVKLALGAAATLAVNNGALALGILYGRKTGTQYLADGCENFSEIVRSPYWLGGIICTFAGVKNIKTKHEIKKKWKHEGYNQDFQEDLTPDLAIIEEAEEAIA